MYPNKANAISSEVGFKYIKSIEKRKPTKKKINAIFNVFLFTITTPKNQFNFCLYIKAFLTLTFYFF